jgi:uncharacterized membrane protein YqjE
VEVSEFGVCLDTEVIGGNCVLLLVSVIVSILVFDMYRMNAAVEVLVGMVLLMSQWQVRLLEHPRLTIVA